MIFKGMGMKLCLKLAQKTVGLRYSPALLEHMEVV